MITETEWSVLDELTLAIVLWLRRDLGHSCSLCTRPSHQVSRKVSLAVDISE